MILKGNNLELLKTLKDNSIDSIVTDPPYGLSFMNKKWDYDVPSVEFWQEVYRVLKPGGHILSFGGTRTYHRMVVNIEDAGFEIRDQIMWVYGSGFPKSHNIGKAIDKLQGNEREIVGEYKVSSDFTKHKGSMMSIDNTDDGNNISTIVNQTKGNSQYEGWGTALKPANEPICVARKPLSEKSVAENVLKWGTGGINIDGCRISTDDKLGRDNKTTPFQSGNKWSNNNGVSKGIATNFDVEGRFPANFIINQEASKLLDEQSGDSKSTGGAPKNVGIYGGSSYNESKTMANFDKAGFGDTGGASRFFYVPKVSKKERNMGLDLFEEKETSTTSMMWNNTTNGTTDVVYERQKPINKNNHPTVKPINLLTYLCRLVTPKGGIILDPFMGSGSTGIAALLEGFKFVGMEMDEDYFKIAETRINNYELYKELIK